MLRSHVASPSFEKKHPGTPPSLSRWYATHSQHLPCLGQGYVQGQGRVLSQFGIIFSLVFF